MARLTASQVKYLTEPGRHRADPTLYLVVQPSGSKSWVQRLTIDGHRRDIGLGGYPIVGLAEARTKALENRHLVATGRDPRADKRRRDTPTFREAAIADHKARRAKWRNESHAAEWLRSLERYAFTILGPMPVHRIQQADVLRVLEPFWTKKPETARRVRQRIRAVLAWAQAHGYIDNNPADARIDPALPPMPKVKAHYRALHYRDVSAALATIDACGASPAAKWCLRFVVLTATRSGEARGARWSEIDDDTLQWRIPAARTKTGAEHRVALSDQAIAVLKQARALDDGSGLVFPSPAKPGHPLSDMALTKVLRDNGLAEQATVHGFRSSFKTWSLEATDTPTAVVEMAMAHTVGDDVEQAYIRTDLYERRAELMQAWATYVTGESRHEP